MDTGHGSPVGIWLVVGLVAATACSEPAETGRHVAPLRLDISRQPRSGAESAGGQGIGGACVEGQDCEPGLRCNVAFGSPGESGEAQGECQPPSGRGGACEAHDDCMNGLVCNGALELRKQGLETCHPPQAAGGFCLGEGECAAPLTCRTIVPGQTGVCVVAQDALSAARLPAPASLSASQSE